MSILRADSIRDRAGTGAPDFPNGLTGNLTGTATTATNAQGLTGTPNITVGTVTGTDATFSGNLTVNGTTTTIDTAVTSVDSLTVDGSVAIGTDSPSAAHNLTVRGSNDTTFTNNPSNIFVAGINTSGSGTAGSGINFGGRYRDDNGNTTAFAVVSGIKENTTHNNWAGALTFATRENGNSGGNQERLRITSGGTAIFKGGLAEKFQTGTTIQADPTIALSDGNIVLRTSNESGNQAINFTGVHSTLEVGQAVSFTVIITPNGSGAINNVQIDATTQVIQWSGGSAPSAGAAGSRDVYTFTILKTGSGTTNYEVFGAATNYA